MQIGKSVIKKKGTWILVLSKEETRTIPVIRTTLVEAFAFVHWKKDASNIPEFFQLCTEVEILHSSKRPKLDADKIQ